MSLNLSDLTNFDNKWYSCCDRTGIVYELIEDKDREYIAAGRFILTDGNGDAAKGFKCEWGTVKDNQMIIGSFGKEWSNDKGEYINGNPMWIKKIDRNGKITHENWEKFWNKMRAETGTTIPGYMFHEAIQWHPVQKKWYVLPRRVSTDPYNPKVDESKGANLMLIADEDFSKIEVVKIQSQTKPTRGFSCFRFIPGTDHILAFKSEEIDNGVTSDTSTYAMVIDTSGNVLISETLFDEGLKFEGLEFEPMHLSAQ